MRCVTILWARTRSVDIFSLWRRGGREPVLGELALGWQRAGPQSQPQASGPSFQQLRGDLGELWAPGSLASVLGK